MTAYVRIVAQLSRITGVFAALLFASCVVVTAHLVFERSVMGRAVIWQVEYITFAVIAATFIGSPYVLLTRGHVSVDVLPQYLGRRGKFWLALAASVLALLFCAVILWYSFEWWLDVWDTGEVKASIWAPKLWIPYLSLPIGLGLLVLQYVADIWCLAIGRAVPFGPAAVEATIEAKATGHGV
jgi:TRAP-type C4-dicarboxylate transport system permease small subunit